MSAAEMNLFYESRSKNSFFNLKHELSVATKNTKFKKLLLAIYAHDLSLQIIHNVFTAQPDINLTTFL